ncbi:ABC transporter ATP-binding protein [Pseudoxanthomonas mexicana]|uniref:ABC transporter ATP-binding protein n=1 Tax=Pseudoxanthomonas mexicana TaxID=128785 RepID=UPI001389AC64|nr:ABC transporter ATP-binding protein [Pseudoxanthomonas mexicana]KAF1724626.1 ABC transporter ATP-binding protein [Pseudoxanthomonas mexicana]
MSSEVAILVENVSKSFAIYETPRDRLKQFLLPRLRRLFGLAPKNYYREFKALSGVSFKMMRGETIGIIGRNGAGKSTLLQIICGTLAASEGSVDVRGRIAALLELGAGFNPEFTGRENAILNGELLGLSRREMELRLPEIEEFAGIGDFIDQPIKTYSSGMYVRLAFAVQACVDPEILIVDEALSVGDIGFQYKCFRRMEELRRKGVTILMVTHSTGSILEYADRCIVMDGGSIQVDTSDVLAAVLTYEKGMIAAKPGQVSDNDPELTEVTAEDLAAAQRRSMNDSVSEKRFGTARAIIERMDITRRDGSSFDQSPVVRSGEELTFRFTIASSEVLDDIALGVSITKTQGGDIWGDNNIRAGFPIVLERGRQVVEFSARLPISAGEYLVHCGLARIANGVREELDQRRPIQSIKFWSPREQVGVVFAPISAKAGTL